MAVSGNEPVSAANLASALGVSASGSIGSQPICVDNLKAVLGSMPMRGEVLWEGSNPPAIEVQHPISEVALIVVDVDGAPMQFPGFVPDQYTGGSSWNFPFQHDGSVTYIVGLADAQGGGSFTVTFGRSTAYIKKVTAYLI